MTRTGADLFCGAGGTSAGYLAACADLGVKADLLAVNHWPRAIATHELNHRGVRHICESLENIRPSVAVPGGYLDLLCASPECTHHSRAAGGRPRNDQSRATAWHVARWATELRVQNLLIENVREFMDWGPLRTNGKPNKRKKGQYFRALIETLRGLGFEIEWRLLTAADYGDPTTRERLFVMGKKKGKIQWPERTHDKVGAGLPRWRAAREIIDWELKGKSIFNRKKALSPNTIRRIAAGLRKFGGAGAGPFLVMLYGTNDARSVDRPAPTVMAGGQKMGLAQPFLVTANHGEGDDTRRSHSLDQPVPTVCCSNSLAVVEPYLVNMKGRSDAMSIDAPAPIITAHASHLYVAEPFVIHSTHHGDRPGHSVDDPLPTVTTAKRGEMALVEPCLLGQHGGAVLRPVSMPVPTVACSGAIALVEPFVVKYYGRGTNAHSVGEPLDTVTTDDRFALIEPRTGRVVAELDILFRMLQPHELAAAQGFPADYQFTGTREERVRQIGNAVPVNLATALCRELLR